LFTLQLEEGIILDTHSHRIVKPNSLHLLKTAFHYSSKLQTWLQSANLAFDLRERVESTSQAGRKHVESKTKANCKLA